MANVAASIPNSSRLNAPLKGLDRLSVASDRHSRYLATSTSRIVISRNLDQALGLGEIRRITCATTSNDRESSQPAFSEGACSHSPRSLLPIVQSMKDLANATNIGRPGKGNYNEAGSYTQQPEGCPPGLLNQSMEVRLSTLNLSSSHWNSPQWDDTEQIALIIKNQLLSNIKEKKFFLLGDCMDELPRSSLVATLLNTGYPNATDSDVYIS